MSVNAQAKWMWPVGLAVLAVLPYITGIPHAFVYDDHGVIVENTFLAEPANIVRVLTLQTLRDPDIVDGQRPVVVATYFLDRWIWGLWPPGYRFTNLLLHAANAVLLYALVLRLPVSTRNARAYAVMTALLFAWHPLNVEAVQSPSFREDPLYVLGGLLFLGALLRPAPTAGHVAGAMAAYAAALLAKESAVVFPVLLAAGWWLFPALRPGRRHITAILIAAAVLTLLFALVVMQRGAVQSLGLAWNGLALRGAERLWSPPWLLFEMLRNMLAPAGLSVDYRFPPVASPSDPRLAAGVFIVALMAFSAWFARRRHPAFSWGLIWTMTAFIPVSNLLPLFNPVADRYAYGILPGFLVALVAALHFLRMRGRFLFIGLAAWYFFLSVDRLRDWRDDRTLWEAALRVEPGSARAHTWLGILEKTDGNDEAAWNHYLNAEELNPHDVSPTINRAIILGEQGRLAEAEALLLEALSRRPDHQAARDNLNHCLYLQGKKP